MSDTELKSLVGKMRKFTEKHGPITIDPAAIYFKMLQIASVTREYVDSLPEDERQRFYERRQKILEENEIKQGEES